MSLAVDVMALDNPHTRKWSLCNTVDYDMPSPSRLTDLQQSEKCTRSSCNVFDVICQNAIRTATLSPQIQTIDQGARS